MIWSLLLVLLAAVPSMWKDWLYSRTISVNSAGLNTFVCPRELYDHAGSRLADLRLIDPKGAEVPFALQKRPLHGKPAWRPVQFVKGPPEQATQMEVVLDMGEQNRLHNLLSLEIPEIDFLAHVELSASDVPDQDWHLMRSDIPIYRYRPDGIEGTQTLAYAENYSRYLKLKITSAPTDHRTPNAVAKPIHLLKCEAAYDDTPQPEWSEYSPVFLNEASPSDMQTWFRADAQINSLPAMGIRVTTSAREFHRALKIAGSNDGHTWQDIASGDIYRTGGEEPAEKMIVETPETMSRYWRVMFHDDGEPPVVIERIVLLGIPYHVVFQATANSQYHLLYGNGKVPAAQYNLGGVVPANAFLSAPKATVGEEELDTVQGHSTKFWVLVIGGALAVVIAGIVLLFAVASEG